MRKKLALFSSLLALPVAFAQQQDISLFHDSLRNVFELIPLDIANTLLAFLTATAIIHGALSMTKLGGGNNEPMKGAGMIAGSLGGTFGIFVYFTGFDFITFVMPFILLLLVIVLFAISMVWLMPPNDPRAADRQRGIALLIAGILLVSLNSSVVKFQEFLSDFAAQTGAPASSNATLDILFIAAPFTTIIGGVLIIWGAIKINNAMRDETENRAGGFMHDLFNRFTGQTTTPPPPGPAALTAEFTVHDGVGGPVIIPGGAVTSMPGLPVEFIGLPAPGGTGPYVYTWDFSGAPDHNAGMVPAAGPNPTIQVEFTAPGLKTVALHLTDSTGGAGSNFTFDFNVL